MTVRTRFAPSPTGYLHIGGVRTALFNWLFAKHNGGQFILRIDDTDQQRNVEEALEPILHGLKWLGINWDEGPGVGGPHAPYYQSQRYDKYQAVVDELIAKGFAYRDYAKPEELQAQRDEAQKKKETFVYNRQWMADTPEKEAQFKAEGRQGVVRLKTPLEGKLELDDLIRGHVEFDWAQEQDHVIQRADGSFIYHLANIVDDHDFEITHVIRAEEHLSNTPRQVFMIDALGWERPQYAHLPFVAEPGSKTKLSKRKLDKYMKNKDFSGLVNHGLELAKKMGLEVSADTFNPVITDFFEQQGYLPEAIVNYLALLGWSLDDHTEDFTPEELIANFTLERVVKGAASFDCAKLLSFEHRYMDRQTVERKTELCLPFAVKAGWVANDDAGKAKVAKVVAGASERIKMAADILNFEEFFLADDALPYVQKDVDKRLKKEGAQALLKKFADDVLAPAEVWAAAPLEEAMKVWLESNGIGIGEIIHALRVATTGKSVGIGMFEALEILGKESTLARIEKALTL